MKTAIPSNHPTVRRFVRGDLVATLYHADCLDLLPIEADAVISDPPYGMDWDGRITRGPNGTGGQEKTRSFGVRIMHDAEDFDPTPWLEYERVVLWGWLHYAQRLPKGTALIWLKRYDTGFGSFLSDADMAWMKGGHGIYCKRDVTLQGETSQKLHPTQKPVPIMTWCIEMAKVPPGATVLDPYMGSGTTGIACLRTGRNFIGIEKDARHFQTACDRIEREVQQMVML